jgi:hypothetical protein
VTRCHQPGAACRPLAHASQGWGRVACQGRDHRAQRERSAGPRMARASRAPIVSHRRAAVRCAVPVAANSPPRAAMPPGSAADTTRRAQHGERWRTMRCSAVLAATLPAVSGRRRAANTRCAPIIAPPARCPEGCFTSFEPPNAARVPSIRLALARTPKACGIGQGSRSCAGVSAAQQGALAKALHAGGVAASHS